MSISDVTARISAIEGQLALLNPAPASTTSGADFAAALASTRIGGSSLAAAPTSALAGGAPSVAPSGGSASEQSVVDEARKYLGVPYVWGGTDPQKGLDCSGLVQLVYKNLGYDLPRVSYQQAGAGTAVTGGLANARPGDLLTFGSPVNHIGIYIGNNQMIHAPRPGKNVEISSVYATPTHIRRVLPAEAAVAPSAVGGAQASATSARVDAAVPYSDLFNEAGARYGVSPTLLSAIAKAESNYNPQAVSPAGAQGLMQLMPGTASGLGVTNSFDPPQAVDGAARMMRDLIERFGQTDLALAAYNAGPGAVTRYNGIPPYPETQNYVTKIMGYLAQGATA